MPFALLLAAALAAPVPVHENADRVRLESLWNDLASEDPIKRTRAAFALVDHPRAVSFLDGKLPKVGVSVRQLKAWLADLDCADEAVWKPAFVELQYHDPRTGLTLNEQLEAVTHINGKRRLVELWCGWVGEFLHKVADAHLRVGETTDTMVTIDCNYRNSYERGFPNNLTFRVATARAHTSPTWHRAAIAAHVLHRRDTPASRAALDRLGTGDVDALPTRTATALRKLKPSAALDREAFATAWADVLNGDPSTSTAAALALAHDPTTAEQVRPALPAIKASKEQMRAWIAALDRADDRVWRPAFDELLYFRPTIALTLDEQCKAAVSDHARSRLCAVWRATTTPDEVKIWDDTRLSAAGHTLYFLIGTQSEEGSSDSIPIDPLSKLNPPRWVRARVAVLLLERMRTGDAKAVLKQLADGHPEILPTREAKAALDRLK